MAAICRERGGANSGRSTGRDRSHADEPTWAQAVRRRPMTRPAPRSATRAQDSWRLRQTAVSPGAGPTNAAALRQARQDQTIGPVPARRTIYRVLPRHDKAGTPPPSLSDTHGSLGCFSPVIPPLASPTARYHAAIENRGSGSQCPGIEAMALPRALLGATSRSSRGVLRQVVRVAMIGPL